MLVLFTGFLQLLSRVLHVPPLNPINFAGLLKNLAEMGTMYNGPSSFSSAVPPDDGPKDLRNSQWNAAKLPSAFSCGQPGDDEIFALLRKSEKVKGRVSLVARRDLPPLCFVSNERFQVVCGFLYRIWGRGETVGEGATSLLDAGL